MLVNASRTVAMRAVESTNSLLWYHVGYCLMLKGCGLHSAASTLAHNKLSPTHFQKSSLAALHLYFPSLNLTMLAIPGSEVSRDWLPELLQKNFAHFNSRIITGHKSSFHMAAKVSGSLSALNTIHAYSGQEKPSSCASFSNDRAASLLKESTKMYVPYSLTWFRT